MHRSTHYEPWYQEIISFTLRPPYLRSRYGRLGEQNPTELWQESNHDSQISSLQYSHHTEYDIRVMYAMLYAVSSVDIYVCPTALQFKQLTSELKFKSKQLTSELKFKSKQLTSELQFKSKQLTSELKFKSKQLTSELKFKSKQLTSELKFKSTITIYNCNGHRSLLTDGICCAFKQLTELQLYCDLRYWVCSAFCSKGRNFSRSFLLCLLLPCYLVNSSLTQNVFCAAKEMHYKRSDLQPHE